MKAAELRDLTYPELAERLDESKEDLFNLRFQLAVSQSDNTARIGGLRREIARIKTVLGEWERDGRPRGYEDYEDYGDYEDEPAEPVDLPDPAAEAPPPAEEVLQDEEDVPPEEPPQEPPAPEEPQEEPAASEEPEEAPAAEEDPRPKRSRLWGKRSRK